MSRVKVIRKIPPEKIKLKPFLIEDDLFWHCEKCKLLYGEGETILASKEGKFCPVHSKRHIYCADIDYWRKNYELGQWF